MLSKAVGENGLRLATPQRKSESNEKDLVGLDIFRVFLKPVHV